MYLAQGVLERLETPVKLQVREALLFLRVDSHDVPFIQVYEPVIERTVIGRREGNAVQDVVGTPRSCHRQDVRCVHKAKLHAGDGTGEGARMELSLDQTRGVHLPER